MILVKIMGIMDILSGLTIILFTYDLIGLKALLAFLVYLIVKGIAFRGDLASIGDFGISIYMIFMIFLPLPLISFIVALYLFQKGIFSIL